MIEMDLGHQQGAMLWNGNWTGYTGSLSSVAATNTALWPMHKAQVICSVLQRKTFANKLAASCRVQGFKFKRLSSIYQEKFTIQHSVYTLTTLLCTLLKPLRRFRASGRFFSSLR